MARNGLVVARSHDETTKVFFPSIMRVEKCVLHFFTIRESMDLVFVVLLIWPPDSSLVLLLRGHLPHLRLHLAKRGTQAGTGKVKRHLKRYLKRLFSATKEWPIKVQLLWPLYRDGSSRMTNNAKTKAFFGKCCAGSTLLLLPTKYNK